jgi:hypothetical protein
MAKGLMRYQQSGDLHFVKFTCRVPNQVFRWLEWD